MTNQEFIAELKRRRIYRRYIKNLELQKGKTIWEYFPDYISEYYDFERRIRASFAFTQTPEAYDFWYNNAHKLIKRRKQSNN